MDFQRLILLVALTFTLMLMWEAWQKDYGPQPVITEQAASSAQPSNVLTNQDLPTSIQATTPSASITDAPVAKASVVESVQRINIETDLLRIEIDAKGGDIRRAELIDYPVEIDKPEVSFRLMDDADELFIAQSGLLSTTGQEVPSHHQIYHSASTNYKMSADSDTLSVTLNWIGKDGLNIDKVYTFTRGSYVVNVDYVVNNSSNKSWTGHSYEQLQRSQPKDDGGKSSFIYTYTGGVVYTQEEKYEKISFDDMKEKRLDRTSQGGWVAMIQHYFLAAWIPSQQEENRFYTKSPGGDRYIIGTVSPAKIIGAGESGKLSSNLFIGPKLQDELEATATGLDLVVDYGILHIIAKPLSWLLAKIHGVVGNWGWAIIILTIMIKAVFYKLSETSYKSMAQMRKFQPKMQAMKERYGDDREALNKATMKLYKEEKINPLGGCLPILVQIPVFIALYWMLLESVEMRQAPFILWIHDLSAMDPYYILPVIMGATMLIQQRLNPTPLDPIQAKIMMALPIVFTFFFAFFPSGLVVYWVANNTLSIIQQWYITRVVVTEK